ncbi:MAG: hypothetical protein IT373_15530 [Polyangiaceae bacterium]|nr:hypothetical protein [Polyangiaceae bacterium]
MEDLVPQRAKAAALVCVAVLRGAVRRRAMAAPPRARAENVQPRGSTGKASDGNARLPRQQPRA